MSLSRIVRICGLLAALNPQGSKASHAPHLQNHARDIQLPGVGQVLELDIPVFTVDAQGELELTDGSETFKVAQKGLPLCQQVLTTYSFANSYGAPYVGNYTPPSCGFNRVTWNLTVTSNGVQYDRLGTVWLGDIEVLRTSTAEPAGTAISWIYLKDMTPYLSLFRREQTIIFDLGNSITAADTAAYNVTLTATYYTEGKASAPADLIIPISKRLSSQGQPSVFSAPGDDATNSVLLPRNIRKAVFTIAATGQDTEEFWWSNVLSSDVNALPDYGELYGYSPFREVQLFIDGSLAGVAWPFPVIFTGAVITGLWEPVVGIDVFDLKEDEIDITPWLPLLCDGNSHTFSLQVTGLANSNGTVGESGTVGSDWLLSGKIFIWYDKEGHITTGTTPHVNAPALDAQVTSTGPGGSGNTAKLYYQVNVQRELEVTSTVKTSNGLQPSSWRQSLSFSNIGNYTEAGEIEVTQQQTTGLDVSSSGYARQISYPFYVYTGYGATSRGITISGTVDRGKNISTIGETIFGGSQGDVIASHQHGGSVQGAALTTYQNASGQYITDVRARTSTTVVTTEQWLSLSGLQPYIRNSSSGRDFPPTSTFPVLDRHVKAVNGSVVDEETNGFSKRSAVVAHQKFGPPRLPGRGYRGRHIPELELNATLSA